MEKRIKGATIVGLWEEKEEVKAEPKKDQPKEKEVKKASKKQK